MEYKEFITKALKESSEIALSYFGKVVGTTKPDDNNQVLTEADLAIGKNVISLIKATYPKHNIIDEEAGVVDNGSDFTWVIDPIDGTSNFANSIPTYGIIIGLLQKSIPIAGGVALPAFFEICVAEKGKGSFCNNEKLSVTKETRLLSSLIAYGIDGHQEDPSLTREEGKILTEIILNIRSLRSSGSAFDGVMFAKGKYGAYLYRTAKIWDNVGMHIVCEEAGAVVTDFFGNPPDYSNPLSKAASNFTMCMGAPGLHKEIQRIIHSR
ncbi:MAG: inositol monophosphatase [Patescibacteria group bacterium]